MAFFKGSKIKQSLQAKEKTCGAWLVAGSGTVAEIMALAGFDWLLIDCEHAPNDFQTLLLQAQVINAANSACLARVPENNKTAIKRVLDIGINGVIIPSINNKKEALEAVAACKYPPLGCRGMASTITRAASYGLDAGKYIKAANEETAVILQIETKEAVDSIDGILKVEGIDAVFVGPTDLSAEMDHIGDKENKEVQLAISKVEKAARASNLALGRAASSWKQAKSYYDKGYCFVSLGADAVVLSKTASELVQNFRKEIRGR